MLEEIYTAFSSNFIVYTFTGIEFSMFFDLFPPHPRLFPLERVNMSGFDIYRKPFR